MAAFTTLAIAALAATAIGTGISVYSAYEQGQVAASAAERNAKAAQNQAANADLENRENIRRQRVENQRLLSQQRVGYAASGVQIGNGSPLEQQADTAAILELDALDRNRASLSQQQSLFDQSASFRASASNYRTAGALNAAGSLFSGVGSMASTGYSANRAGVFSSTGSSGMASYKAGYGGASAISRAGY